MNLIYHIRSLLDGANKAKALECGFITVLVVLVIYLIGSGI